MVRYKNRYVVIEINQVDTRNSAFVLRQASLYSCIMKKIQQVHGDFGVAAVKSGLVAKYCNKWTRIAMVRVRHGAHRLVTTCLPLINELEKHAVAMNILYIGATLQQCYRYIINHQKRCLEKLWSELGTEELRSTMQTAIMDLSCLERDGKTVETSGIQNGKI